MTFLATIRKLSHHRIFPDRRKGPCFYSIASIKVIEGYYRRLRIRRLVFGAAGVFISREGTILFPAFAAKGGFMRLATFVLAILGLLAFGTTFAFAQNRPANIQAAPRSDVFVDRNDVRAGGPLTYWSGPRKYYYHRPVRYYSYSQTGLWLSPPFAIHYYANPYPGYSYYPNGIGYRNY